MVRKQYLNFAFVGVLGLNIFRPGVAMDKDRSSTATAEKRERIEERVEQRAENREARMEKFKDTRAVLKNVKVTALGASSITVDNSGTSVVVNITDKTELRRKFWGKSTIAEFSVGDTVNVIGKWTDETKTAINAMMIRNESIQMRYGTFFGTVKSVSSTGFVISTIHRDDETVTVGSAKLINRKEETIVQTDIKVGDRVRVKGMWNNDAKTITEVKEIKNFSLPLLPSRAPKASTSATPVPTVTP